MIAVVGAGRCGTSLMMQTLELLGVPLYGAPGSRGSHQLWQEWHKLAGIEIPKDISNTHNLKGYYEVSVGEINNFIYGNKTTDKAVKFTCLDIIDIPLDKLTHIIYCYREDIKAAAASMDKLAKSDLEYAKEMGYENVFANIYSDISLEDWLDHMNRYTKLITSWLKSSAVPYIKVKFEDITTNPEPIIKHIGDFLNFDDPNISAALKNVDKRCD